MSPVPFDLLFENALMRSICKRANGDPGRSLKPFEGGSHSSVSENNDFAVVWCCYARQSVNHGVASRLSCSIFFIIKLFIGSKVRRLINILSFVYFSDCLTWHNRRIINMKKMYVCMLDVFVFFLMK